MERLRLEGSLQKWSTRWWLCTTTHPPIHSHKQARRSCDCGISKEGKKGEVSSAFKNRNVGGAYWFWYTSAPIRSKLVAYVSHHTPRTSRRFAHAQADPTEPLNISAPNACSVTGACVYALVFSAETGSGKIKIRSECTGRECAPTRGRAAWSAWNCRSTKSSFIRSSETPREMSAPDRDAAIRNLGDNRKPNRALASCHFYSPLFCHAFFARNTTWLFLDYAPASNQKFWNDKSTWLRMTCFR